MARLLWIGALAGCASIQPGADRTPLDDAGAPGAIAVVVQAAAPKAAFATPGYPESLAGGALTGGLMGAWAGYGLAPLALLGGPATLAAAAAAMSAIFVGGVVIGVVGGTAAGASVVVPADEVAAIKQMMDNAIAELRLPELTATAIVTDVGRWSPYRAEVVADAGPASPTDASYFRSLRERGYSAALDVRLVKVGFVGRGGSDPGIRLILSAEAQLIDTATGAPTALRGLVYLSPPHDETGWTRDGGALMKAEIERAYWTLAERLVDSLVLRTEIFVGFDGPPPPYTCGVEPTRPKLEWEGVLFGVRHPATAVVQSLNPVLAWEGVPAPMAANDEKRIATIKAADVRYDLRVWKSVDDAPAEIVYQRDGLDRTEHRLETALEPGSTYFWSVRLRYRADGQPRASRWSAANVPKFIPPMPLGDALYYSRIEGEMVKPVPCTLRDLTPCGCLDFIPRHNFFRFRTP